MDQSDNFEEDRQNLPQQQQGHRSSDVGRQRRADRQLGYRGGRRQRDDQMAPPSGIPTRAVAGPMQHASYPARHQPVVPQHFPPAAVAVGAPPNQNQQQYMGMMQQQGFPSQQYMQPYHQHSPQHQPHPQHPQHPHPQQHPHPHPQHQHSQQQHAQHQHHHQQMMYNQQLPQQMMMQGGPQYAVPMMPPQHPYVQPAIGRLPADRPIVKLSVSLIDTYKRINKVYYEEREERRRRRAEEKGWQQGDGVNNYGWDDENYDYILTSGERFNERYIIKERIGKGSFGQVVRAVDTQTGNEVAIKIIKSKKPFLIQAKTEIELLSHLTERDDNDQNNIVRLIEHFMYRNHQCLVFEMLSLNLYELLKNTQFGGVSLNLIRKFAKQILTALSFLARPDVDIIHCDLKPENILLRHPKRSGIKVIDFGSSCKSNKRMYSYIQSRFYRSPEVMLGLPYSVAIDMWSLGCILVEMHTGEPLFSGSDQLDQMQKIVKVLGMLPEEMLQQCGHQHCSQFFERERTKQGNEVWVVKQTAADSSASEPRKGSVIPSMNPVASLAELITGSESGRKKKYPPTEPGHSARNYEMFVDLIYRMLAYRPEDRLKPHEGLQHPFIVAGERQQSAPGHYSSEVARQQQQPDSSSANPGDVVENRSYLVSGGGRQRQSGQGPSGYTSSEGITRRQEQ